MAWLARKRRICIASERPGRQFTAEKYDAFNSYGVLEPSALRRRLTSPPAEQTASTRAPIRLRGSRPSSGRRPIPSCDAVKFR